jgi:hypothetical protein
VVHVALGLVGQGDGVGCVYGIMRRPGHIFVYGLARVGVWDCCFSGDVRWSLFSLSGVVWVIGVNSLGHLLFLVGWGREISCLVYSYCLWD